MATYDPTLQTERRIRHMTFADLFDFIAMDQEMDKAALWAAEQMKANERAAAEWLKAMYEHADAADLLATQESARF